MSQGRRRSVRIASSAALAWAALAHPMALRAQNDAGKATRPRSLYEDLQMFSGVLNLIRVNHPDSVDQHDLIMGAIRGMVERADPHSYVIPSTRLSPEKMKAVEEGKAHPVPITFDYRNGAFMVVGVTPGSSAAKGEILPGDELIAIDGAPVRAESADELYFTLVGPRGDRVRLTFVRLRSDGSTAQFDRDVKFERQTEMTNVPTAFMADSITGYVRITEFSNFKVADDLHDALGRLERSGMKRLILDLRDNPGGLVSQAAAVAGEFLPKGSIVYTTVGRKESVSKDTGRVERSFFSHEKRYPMVVMVNGGSASASELVAGALQDHDRALIVGRPSFGKSLVMYPFYLADGSQMMMVVGHLRTPCGRVIQRQYHGMSVHEYRREAGAARDTVGRPSCHTDAGRTVYGGGGVYPDVALAREPYPPWLSDAVERGLTVKWAASWLTSNIVAAKSVEAFAQTPVLSAEALAQFRTLAASNGITIPTGPDVDRRLKRELLRRIADAKWSDAGYYRVDAALDPEISAAMSSFDRAASILSK